MHVAKTHPVLRALWGTTIALVLSVGALAVAPAEARELEDCQLFWGQAVRGYLTQNRTKGPEDDTFKPACELEAKGDKPGARIEAIMIGLKALAGLDQTGCKRFMEFYVGATLPGKLCESVGKVDEDSLRKMVSESLPPPPAPRPAK